MIFMDAAKGQYQAFLPHCLRLLPVGGLLIVDDVLQGGTDCHRRALACPRRQRTIHKRLRNFLWEITHHDALETSIIPIGDGVALCYKKKEIIPETKTEGETKMQNKKKLELLAPAGDLEKLKIAVLYGADAVYIGGEAYGLRAKAKNFDIDTMAEGVKFAHDHGVKVYVTANIFAHNPDFEGMADYFKAVEAIGVVALIISDLGVFSVAKEAVPNMEILFPRRR